MKFKKEILFTAITVFIFAVFLYLETQLPFFKKFLPMEENKILVFVLNINLLLILLVIFLISRTLVKSYVEKKRGIWGSGLKTKLTIMFLFFSIVPSFTLSILATGFFHISLDKWFSQKIEDTMDNTLLLSHFYYNDLSHRYEKLGGVIAKKIEKRDLADRPVELKAYLKADPEAKLLEFHSIHDVSGTVIISNLSQGIDAMLSGRVDTAAKRGSTRDIIPLEDGEMIMIGTRILDKERSPRAILFAGNKIGIQSTQKIMEITSVQKEFKESRAFKKIVKYGFYIPLSLITILTIFFSVWFGVKIAKEITTPIEQVKEGASIIASGKFDIKLEDSGKDEISTLVSAFNSMARELKIAKEEIEAKRKYMEVIFDNVVTGIISTDKMGFILFLNKAAQNILGVRKESWEGAPLKEIFGDKFKRHMKFFLKAARKPEGGSVSRDMRVNFDNDIKYIRASLNTLKDEESQTEGFIITFDDITHIVRAERLSTWREIAKKLTHEIKNPLTPIILSAERIRRRIIPRTEGKNRDILDETTSIIVQSVNDIKTIVNELTKLTHTSQPKAMGEINTVLEDALSLYKNLYQNISFQFTPSPIPPFRLDRDSIKRAVTNLISNSVKAIGENEGIISLTTKYSRNRASCVIEMADNGKGISDEEKSRIFDPYFTKDMYGMGLGLAIVHSIVLEHHGRVRVEDNTPRGVKFIIELPIIES